MPDQPSARRWRDGLAAVNAAVIALPQEINYGLLSLAPLGALFGARGIVAALFGSCFGMLAGVLAGNRFGQILGSRPTLSLIIAAVAAGIVLPDGVALAASELALPILFAVVILAGLLQIAFARLGVGRLIKYLPYPVLAGFTNGVAVLIALSAVKKLFADGHPLSLLIVAITLAVASKPLRGLPWRAIPGALQAVLAGSLTYHLLLAVLGADALGPALPPLTVNWPHFEILQAHWPASWSAPLYAALFLKLLPFAFAIALLASLETLLAAATLDSITGERSDSDRELLANGLANVGAGLCGGTAVAGSLSRSQTLLRSGATSRLAMYAYVAIVAIVLFAALPLIALLPEAVIAAIMLLVASQMINDWTRQLSRQVFLQRRRLAAAQRREVDQEFLVMLLVTATAVIADLKTAVLLGVLMAMLLFVRSNSRSPVRRVQRGSSRHSLKWRSHKEQQWLASHGEAIILLEAEGILFFGTVDSLSRAIERLLDEAGAARHLIIDCRHVVDIDATGARLLQQVAQRLHRSGISLQLAHLDPAEHKARFLRAMGIERDLPASLYRADDDRALEYAEDQLLGAGLGIAVSEERLDLADSALGDGLAAAQLALLAAAMQRQHYAAGDAIFRTGEAGRSLFLVVHGSVSIRLGQTGKRVAAFGPGVVFGEMALLEGKPRSADAIADAPTEVLELSDSAFAALCQQQPALATHLLRQLGITLADRLRQTTGDLQQILAA